MNLPSLLGAIPWVTVPRLAIGPIQLHTFGLLVAAGIALGRAVTRRALAGSTVDLAELDRVIWRSVIVGLAGARLAWVLTHLSQVDGVGGALAVWDGGLQFSGGFIAGVAVAIPWFRRQAADVRRRVGDAAALGMAPGLALGRLGCVAVGEHLGGTTTFLLGTRYLGGEVIEGPLEVGTTYHNTAVYEMLHLALLTGLLLVAHRRGWLRLGDGHTAALFLGWYAVGRFLTDLTRTADASLGGLTGAQWVAALVLAPAAVMMWRRRPTAPHVEPTTDEPDPLAMVGSSPN